MSTQASGSRRIAATQSSCRIWLSGSSGVGSAPRFGRAAVPNFPITLIRSAPGKSYPHAESCGLLGQVRDLQNMVNRPYLRPGNERSLRYIWWCAALLRLNLKWCGAKDSKAEGKLADRREAAPVQRGRAELAQRPLMLRRRIADIAFP